jgi:hypothetical protein
MIGHNVVPQQYFSAITEITARCHAAGAGRKMRDDEVVQICREGTGFFGHLYVDSVADAAETGHGMPAPFDLGRDI